MKRVRNGLLLIAVLLLAQTGMAQSLSIHFVGGTTLTSGELGTVDSFSVWVVNNGGNAVVGELDFGHSINGATVLQSDTPNVAIGYDAPQDDSIPANDSIQFRLAINYSVSHFSVGPSVVIIWPIINGATVADSLFANVEVQYAGIEDLQAGPKMYLFNNNLIINDPDFSLNRVRIFDLEGRLLIDNQLETSTILPLNGLSPGTYFAEVLYGDNRRKVLQFVTQ